MKKFPLENGLKNRNKTLKLKMASFWEVIFVRIQKSPFTL